MKKGETPMPRKKQEINPVDVLLDELLTENAREKVKTPLP